MFTLFVLIIKWLLILLMIIGVVIVFFIWFAPTFGGKPDADTLARIKASPNHNGKTFTNLTQTDASTLKFNNFIGKRNSADAVEQQIETGTDSSSSKQNLLRQFIFLPKGKNPTQPINTVPLNLIADRSQQDAKKAGNTLKDGEFVWMGHSTVLFRTAGKTFITDPVFHSASPLPIGLKPFAMSSTPTIADLPFIDVVLISHDHYDHLDHKAIKKLVGKVGHFYVPLGVKSHLIKWGIAAQDISEFDWYESIQIQSNDLAADTQNNPSRSNEVETSITVTFAPTRHFSGRRITGHRTTLWGSWAVQSPQLSVYFSGDGGYSKEFANIGKRFGGFDIAFIEDGAYNERWQEVHMLPEESAQAGIDVGAKVVLPIHWGKFDLSTHHWREPVSRIKTAIERHNQTQPEPKKVKLVTPRIGEVFDLEHLPTSLWWEDES